MNGRQCYFAKNSFADAQPVSRLLSVKWSPPTTPLMLAEVIRYFSLYYFKVYCWPLLGLVERSIALNLNDTIFFFTSVLFYHREKHPVCEFFSVQGSDSKVYLVLKHNSWSLNLPPPPPLPPHTVAQIFVENLSDVKNVKSGIKAAL